MILVNAPPDLAAQLAATPALWPIAGTRLTPLRRVLLTDAQLDHVLGLFELRQAERLEVLGPPKVIRAVRDDLGLGRTLESYTKVDWREVETEASVGSLSIRPIETGGGPPKYAGAEDADGWSVGYEIEAGGRSIVYAPTVTRATPELLAACERASFVAFDGTFWSDDEPSHAGVGGRSASQMGHLPVERSIGQLARLEARVEYTHLNNTNPLLDPGSSERQAIAALGIDVASDGEEGTA